jgi:hypothetical protein
VSERGRGRGSLAYIKTFSSPKAESLGLESKIDGMENLVKIRR